MNSWSNGGACGAASSTGGVGERQTGCECEYGVLVGGPRRAHSRPMVAESEAECSWAPWRSAAARTR